MLRARSAVLWTIIAWAGCAAGGGPVGPVGAPTPGQPPAPTPKTPLFVPAERIAAVRDAAARGTAEWKAMKARVDADIDKAGLGEAGVMNVAVTYLGTGDRHYCDRLNGEARAMMAASNPRGDSYYNYAAAMTNVAAILTFCGPVLEPTVRDEMAAYLDRWTDELWFKNQGSGWGLKDPGNNYHISFLLGTASSAVALGSVGHSHAAKYLDMAHKGIDEELAYVAARCVGGGWIEGTNYGEGSKGRLADYLSIMAAATGRNAFRESTFFTAMLLYAHHQLQPGNQFLFPAGDMARESNMTANPYSRQYVQATVFWLPDSDARRLGAWYLEHVTPNYSTGFNHPTALWRDVVYKIAVPARAQSTLPLSFLAKGDDFMALRSGWDGHATALMVSGGSQLDQSHGHLDTGGFTLWRDGWQAVDSVTYSHSGLLWDPGAHNAIHVDGARRVAVSPRGVVHFADDGRIGYVQIDATALYSDGRAPLMTEVTREIVYLRPSTVVVYDRVVPARPETGFNWRMHFAARPAVSGQTVTARNEGGAITVALLVGDAPVVRPDTDLVSDPEGSRAFRVQATSPGGRYLAAIRVASGSPPPLEATRIQTSGDVDGAVVGTDVVVFSKRPFGQPAAPGWSYSVPTVAGRVHTLVDLAGPVGVTVKKAGGQTTVTIGAGADRTASADGVVSFTE